MKLLLLISLISFINANIIDINNKEIINIHGQNHLFTQRGKSFHPSHVFDFSSLPVEKQNKLSYCSNNVIHLNFDFNHYLLPLSKPIFITNLPCCKIFRVTEIDKNTIIGYSTTLGHIMPELDLKIQPLQIDNEKQKYFCLGVNVKHDNDISREQCNQPNNILTLYSYNSPVGLRVDLTCPECLISFQGNLFIHIVIETTKLAKVKAGFTNTTLHTSMIINFDANEYYNIGVDKLLPAIPPTNLFSFSLLTIPINFWFELPVKINGNLAFSAEGNILYGFRSSYFYDDYFIEWTKDHPKWNMYIKTPKIDKETVFNASANIEVNSFLEINPGLNFNLDKVFHSVIETTPQLNGDIIWDSTTSQLCSNLTTQTTIDVYAEFDLDINWLGLHDQYKWGPKIIYNDNESLESKCIIH